METRSEKTRLSKSRRDRFIGFEDVVVNSLRLREEY